MNVIFRLLFAATALLVAAFMPMGAFAQGGANRSAGEKITGEAYWPKRAAGHYLQSAQSYTQDFQAHVARAGRPEPVVVQEVQRTLASYLDEANKHLVTMKKDFASDKDTVAAVEAIERDLAKAVSQNKDMIACCKEEKFDKAMAMTCCTDLAKHLGKIHADHVALMKKLASKASTK